MVNGLGRETLMLRADVGFATVEIEDAERGTGSQS